MPTVTDSNVVAEPKTQTEVPLPVERELFAAEIEMEKKSSNFFPLLLILGLVVVVGGTIYYFVKGARDVLTPPVATATINGLLAAEPPALVHFRTGVVTSSGDEKPMDPHYKLLAKAGFIVAKPKGANSLIVNLTPVGERLLGDISGLEKTNKGDGTTSYQVPLAVRKLVSVDNVNMIKPHLAQVTYTWKWSANRLGTEFDASGALVKSFSMWDRATLIKSYGVDFYSADPVKAKITLIEGNEGNWKPYTE